MATALIVYGSTTGNTKWVAKQIGEVLGQEGIEVTIKNVAQAQVGQLGNDFDLTLLGSSTWGDAEIEFQEDFAPFYEEMGQADLKERRRRSPSSAAAIPATSFFCGAVDLLEEKAVDLEGCSSANRCGSMAISRMPRPTSSPGPKMWPPTPEPELKTLS